MECFLIVEKEVFSKLYYYFKTNRKLRSRLRLLRWGLRWIQLWLRGYELLW